jgi:hypothetical protein
MQPASRLNAPLMFACVQRRRHAFHSSTPQAQTVVALLNRLPLNTRHSTCQTQAAEIVLPTARLCMGLLTQWQTASKRACCMIGAGMSCIALAAKPSAYAKASVLALERLRQRALCLLTGQNVTSPPARRQRISNTLFVGDVQSAGWQWHLPVRSRAPCDQPFAMVGGWPLSQG